MQDNERSFITATVTDANGFVGEAHLVLTMTDAMNLGVFAAGVCPGDKCSPPMSLKATGRTIATFAAPRTVSP